MQLAFHLRTWGGRRKGAGRKPVGARASVSHRTRPSVSVHQPLHVTLRVREAVPNLRTSTMFRAVRAALEAGAERFGFRLVHFSVLRNHLHLIAEADDKVALARGMKGLKVRVARAINRVAGRRGTVFSDRYHAHALRSPSQTRNALAYVLNNFRKHEAQRGRRLAPGFIDPCSSAAAFDGWRERDAEPSTLARAVGWMLRKGWRKRGLLSVAAVPGEWLPRRACLRERSRDLGALGRE
ncbi:MAG: transposase [Deltaproteobacteria bacterium]